ncbi:MAG: hypothetical protein IT210_04340 [Armatimonadetes bacterium]|nr:hypothetical protein [Armatimonadota bacterium]
MSAVLADGIAGDPGFCRATVLWEGRPIEVVALEAEGTPLVGVSLLYGSRLTMAIIDGGPVAIEGLA